ncbi:MAG: class II fructose-bisphosphate aldolase [Thermaerobacter sp.]|nr:class II fructose-bisphosphate aldolase [Thermaerobacter sp.]
MLINLRAALTEGSCACLGFNVTTLEALDALMAVAERRPGPTILQMTDRYVGHFGESLISNWMVPRLAASPKAFVLHLDHGVDLDAVHRALDLGFTSVMYDGSRKPLADNVAGTRLAAEVARRVGASVEAEVGHVGGKEDGSTPAEDSWLTTIEDARTFVAGVDVDALAISVGSVHGAHPLNQPPHLRLDRIRDIAAVVAVPLVLHGGSGLPPSLLQQAIRAGIRKVNIGTELKRAWLAGIEAAAQATQEPWEIRERTTMRLMTSICQLENAVCPPEHASHA